ncbi:site-specific integrase [Bosea sp. BIWAKO-01]|uniref:tyrosine-type recombinase/integrase n=1 Tax=Bosea sp. BIWAKO-01 TaxID=506668 RepID=UPI00085313C5|nr:site-specific integrase [Bosea sp. BIWAKO-01]
MPKAVPALTATAVRSIKPPREGVTEVADGGCPGLRLRVSAAGDRRWTLMITDSHGRRRRFDVGTYPTTGLSDARTAAHSLREKVRQGYDPVAEKIARLRRQDAAHSGSGTLAALIDAYGGTEGNAKRGWRDAKARCSSVFNCLLERPALDLTLTDLQLAVDGHSSKSSAAAAVRYLRPMLKWGSKRGLCPKGIAAELEQPRGANRARARYLCDDEIRAVLGALDTPHLAGGYADCMRWLFWTACRLDEAVGATFGEIESGIWLIPASRTKSARDHAIPLPRQAIEFLQGRQDGAADLLFCNRRGGRLENWPKFQLRLFSLTSTSGWHRHDIRRTVATRLGNLGVAPHVIEVVLGHAVPHTALANVYNKSRYFAEHREAIQALADDLDQLRERPA